LVHSRCDAMPSSVEYVPSAHGSGGIPGMRACGRAGGRACVRAGARAGEL
jgi:hypothetical protein